LTQNGYKGMRWFKCDLQMQTPADAQHWQGKPLNETNAEAIAEEYARACYKAGLDVIGITDHNFLSKEFIPVLRSALDRLEGEYGRHITLFPGYEMEADVGKGIHVLCLFDPDTELETIDHMLTECGVSHPRVRDGKLVKSNKRLPEILSIAQKVQTDGKWRGIVIVPHVFEDSLFDNERLNDWLQQEEYLNLDLLAVEVPKPVTKMSQNFQKLFRAGDDCLPEWKRKRPIATIMSSDNKKLVENGADGRPTSNSIGYRYTWIKMSEPSIESLRQAFMDHESRIRLPDDVVRDVNPTEREHHARILSISIKNAAFLQDHEIQFSQNLNCIIGGRGTGKSTILEGMRLALGKDGEKGQQIDDDTRAKIDRIRELLNRNSATEVRVRWRSAAGVEDTLLYKVNADGKSDVSVEGRDMADLASYLESLPVQFFSQQQINQITSKTGNMLLSLLDDFIRDRLTQLDQEELEVRNEIRRIFALAIQLEQVESDIKRLTQEITERTRQIEALASLQDNAKRHQDLTKAGAYIKRLREDVAGVGNQVIRAASGLTSVHAAVDAAAQGWPEGAWFDQADEQVRQAKDELMSQIQAAIDHYQRRINNVVFEDTIWADIERLIAGADDEFRAACAKKGISTEDITRVQEINQQLIAKKGELTRKQSEQKRLQDERDQLPTLFERLHNLWRDVYQARQTIAEEIEGLTQETIDLQIEFSAEPETFSSAWNKVIQDGRPRVARNWSDFGELVLKVFNRKFQETADCEIGACLSPWQMVDDWLNGEKRPEDIDKFLAERGVQFADVQSLLRDTSRDQWQNVRLTRVADKADLILYRADNSGAAGRISDGSLSDGQRNTATLAMILAKGDTPLVFDQPEDELDSNYIYGDLVPMLRRMKLKRQVIVVTHNANVPVNADAELVYALETKNGRGSLRAQGGIDQQPVTQAVLEIMEGSEQAFKRRGEKYHF